MGPIVQGSAHELWSVVHEDLFRHLLRLDQTVQKNRDPLARQGEISLDGRTDTTKVIY